MESAESKDLQELKAVLRSLVVSSPLQMTLQALLRDYRHMMGVPLPLTRYGYRDPMLFIKERCGDCFKFQGSPSNPVLIPIVPEQLKHIDDFVQKQRVSSKVKYIGKRRSIQEPRLTQGPDLVVKSFQKFKIDNDSKVKPREVPIVEESRNQTIQHNGREVSDSCELTKSEKATDTTGFKKSHDSGMDSTKSDNRTSMEAYRNFIRKRLPAYDSNHNLDDEKSYKDSDSGHSSTSSTKRSQLEELKAEVTQLVLDSDNGVWCTDLMKLYRERYGRELNFSRFGYTSVGALAGALAGVGVTRDPRSGRALLHPPDRPPPAHRPAAHSDPPPHGPATPAPDPDDALPWIDFDSDVFPPDCVSYSESIPATGVGDWQPGDMVELMVGEVYSPSHFWFYRLGPRHHLAMEDMMDEMTEYYGAGEGRTRTLAPGAVRVGHYCSSVYERDWHRSLIVRLLDCDTVKVRHVDYGTVDRVPRASLRPLLRRWARLPAQAVRARLAGVRPGARARRWPHAACVAFLRLVQDRRLVGNVVHVDHEESIVELLLIDTSGASDVRIDSELVRSGYADPRRAPPAAAPEPFLYPRFDALETGDTPNFADITGYLRDGIALDFVHDYRRHVPSALPDDDEPSPEPPAPCARPVLDTRVPLLSTALALAGAELRTPTPPPSPPAPASPPPATPPPASPPPPRPAAYVAPASRASTPPRPRACKPAQPPPPPPYSAPFFVFHPPMAFPPLPPFPCSSLSLLPPPMPLPSPYSSLPPSAFPSAEPPPPAPAPPQSRRVTTGAGDVTLSVSECEIFSLLSSVDPNAAHWYIVDAISRARGCSATSSTASGSAPAVSASRLNPLAREFRAASTQTGAVPPPPGFEGHRPRPRPLGTSEFVIQMPF